MAERGDGARLARLHRVRRRQSLLAEAEATRAAAVLADAQALAERIARLAAATVPVAATAPVPAAMLGAAAHLRARLHDSAAAAAERIATADAACVTARATAQAAERDRRAVEKLGERAAAAARLRELRRLEAMPVPARPKRHGPC